MHLQLPDFGHLQADRILELLVREIVLAVKVDMLPRDDRTRPDGGNQVLLPFLVLLVEDSLREVKVVPADYRVLDEAAARFRYLLFGRSA